MSSFQPEPQPQRRLSSANMPATDDDADLTTSLNRLTLVTAVHESSSLAAPSSPLAGKSATPLRPASRRSSSSPGGRRVPSRSPSGRETDPSSPKLLRKASMNSLHSANGIPPGKVPSRRSSAAHLSPSKAMPPPPEETPIPTAESIAHEYFQSELQLHHGSETSLPSDTIVILNDAVYGHRFSRPRTSRNALMTIVERPERIKAGVLGISAAYVMLGGRHAEGALPIDPKRDVHSIPKVPFRIRKTQRKVSLLSPAVTNVHGQRWMEELKLMCENAEARLAMGGKELARPSMPRGSDQATPAKLHEGDLYLCSESQNAMEGALGAVCEAVDTVFSGGPRRAFVGVRPPGHHCSASHPSGFCWVNNVHVGIMHAALTHDLTHAVIIDFDLHHGDGSQDITWQHNTKSINAPKNAAPWKKTSIAYFSLHDINSYPCEYGDEEKVKNASLCIDNAHGQSIWNVHLQSWKSEQDFWKLYEERYSILLDKARTYLRNQVERLRAAGLPPKSAIFFSAGFDASEWESAGMQRHQVNVPTEFYARIAQDVVKLAAEEGLYVDGRIVSVLEGGYSDRAICSGVLSHLSGLAGTQAPENAPVATGGLGVEMGQKIGLTPETSPETTEASELASFPAYNPSWWASTELDKLEGVTPPPPPFKPRKTETPMYCSPTQASTAKVSDPAKMRHSLSGLYTLAQKNMLRPVSPPPPEVSWTTAAHELCKILIPSHRQTDSHKAEELNAEASKVRRDRQSAATGLPPPPTPEGRTSSRMALRGRKPKAPTEEDAVPRTPRRRVAAPPPASADKVMARGNVGRRASRRLSGASTILSPTTEGTVPRDLADGTPLGPTSQPLRPGPADMRTQSADQVPMRKVRATPKAPKRDALPKVARSAKKPGPSSATGSSRPGSGQEASRSSTATDDLDKITSGMKKIKINLITQSQKEAREKARRDGQSGASTPVEAAYQVSSTTDRPLVSPNSGILASTSVVDDFEGVSPTSTNQSEAQLPPLPSARLSTPVQQQSFSSAPITPHIGKAEPVDTSPAVPYLSVQPGSDPTDLFVPYYPDGPDPVPVAQSEPLKWMPTNTGVSTSANTPAATPSPVKKKDKQDNLFHYTSGIPFAARAKEPASRLDHAVGPDGSSIDETVMAGSMSKTPEPSHR